MGTPLYTGDVFQWARFCNDFGQSVWSWDKFPTGKLLALRVWPLEKKMKHQDCWNLAFVVRLPWVPRQKRIFLKKGQTVSNAGSSTQHWNNYCASFMVYFELRVGLQILLLCKCKLSFQLVSSVGRSPVCGAGGCRFELQPDQHSESINNREESAAFVMTSALAVRLSSLLR